MANRFLKLPEVVRVTTWPKSTIYAGIKAGTFPEPIQLGARAVAWVESDIQNWIAERIANHRKSKVRTTQ